MEQHTLAGQVALVTGSGRGLGRAVADRLAALGANVAVHDITTDAPAEFGEGADLEAVVAAVAKHGTKVTGVTGDIGDEGAVRAFVAQAEAALGPITILINCAGGDIAARGGKPQPNNALGIPIEDVRALLDRNLIGTMLVCRAVCPGMMERKGGAVVKLCPRRRRMWVWAMEWSMLLPRRQSCNGRAAWLKNCVRTGCALMRSAPARP